MCIYRPKGSKVYWMDFFYAGTRIRESTHQTSSVRAQDFHDRRKQSLKDSASGFKKRERPKMFSVAYAAWLAKKSQKWSAATKSLAEFSYKHLEPVFGKKLVIDISADGIRAYQEQRRGDGVSNRTINIETGLIRSVLPSQGTWEHIRLDFETLEEAADKGHALTAGEQETLLEECANSRSRILRPFVELAIETAARYGTIRRLQWRNVDFARRALKFGRDKTAAGSGREIPLMPRAFETLRFWAESFPDRKPEHYVFARESYGGAGADDVFGFTGTAVYKIDPGEPTGSVKKAWEQARLRTRRHCPACQTGRLVDAKSPATGYACDGCHHETPELPRGLTQVRFHDLRHTAITRLVAAGVPLIVVGKIAGWREKSFMQMAARYSHPSLDTMRAAMSTIDGKFEPPTFAESPQIPPKTSPSEDSRIQ